MTLRLKYLGATAGEDGDVVVAGHPVPVGSTIGIPPMGLAIGRLRQCDIACRSECIARRHTELRWRDGQLTVRDLGSTNGTLVDGAHIPSTQDVVLSAGQEIAPAGRFRFGVVGNE